MFLYTGCGCGLSFILREPLACGYGVIYVVVLAVQRKPKCFAVVAKTNVGKLLRGWRLGCSGSVLYDACLRVVSNSLVVDGDFEVWQSESADTTGDPEPVFFVAVSQLGVDVVARCANILLEFSQKVLLRVSWFTNFSTLPYGIWKCGSKEGWLRGWLAC